MFKHNALGFHKNARPAAIASMAAARQGHFWKYHDVLFANQKALEETNLFKYAEDLGLDMEAFKKDFKDPSLGRKVDNDQAASVALGATGTPAFFVNGVKLSGAKPFEDFKTEIDKQLEKAKGLTAAGVAKDQIARKIALDSGATAAKFVKYMLDEHAAPPPPKKPERKSKKEDTTTVWKVPIDVKSEAVKGPKYAPITIVEFSDFECPFCSKVNPTYKKILEEYKDKVRVFFKHTPLPFHKNAPLAHEASLAAGAQGKFWEMHDLLFANQKKLTRPELEGYAKELGLKMPAFNKALDKGTHKARIEADQALGESVQAKGTPNHFINGRKLTGAKAYEDFKKIIDEELKKTKTLMDAGTPLDALYDKLIAKGKVFSPLDAAVKQFNVDKNGPSKGAKNGRITLVEFSDFQCPYCSRITPPINKLLKKYPNDIVLYFMQFPLGFHKEAQKAAEAALAAHAQGRFWDMHDIMFANQKGLQVEKLMVYAKQIGLDVERFKADLDSGKYADAVKKQMAEGKRGGVRGTPSLYINGRKYSPSGGYTVAAMEKLLAKEFGLRVK